ncbi:MAG: hypothetical protein Q7U78_13925 [Gallionella sp.]|nr:hypothetical protein [Gallionella sp.]
MSLRERLQRYMLSREQIHGNSWLAWLGPWLHDPKLCGIGRGAESPWMWR